MNIHNHLPTIQLGYHETATYCVFLYNRMSSVTETSCTQRVFVINEFKCKLLQSKFFPCLLFCQLRTGMLGSCNKKKYCFSSTHGDMLLKWHMHVYSWRKWEKLFLFRKEVWDNFLSFQRTLSKVPVHSQVPQPLTSWSHNYCTLVSMLAKCKPFSILVDIKLLLSSGSATVKT